MLQVEFKFGSLGSDTDMEGFRAIRRIAAGPIGLSLVSSHYR